MNKLQKEVEIFEDVKSLKFCIIQLKGYKVIYVCTLRLHYYLLLRSLLSWTWAANFLALFISSRITRHLVPPFSLYLLKASGIHWSNNVNRVSYHGWVQM